MNTAIGTTPNIYKARAQSEKAARIVEAIDYALEHVHAIDAVTQPQAALRHVLTLRRGDWRTIAIGLGYGAISDETIGRILARYQSRQHQVDPMEGRWLS